MLDILKYIQPSKSIESKNDLINNIKNQLISNNDSNQKKAIELFYFVRDNIKYIAHIYLDSNDYKSSKTLSRGEGNCVSKAILLCSLMRAASIPSRLGFADLICHQKDNKLKNLIGPLFYYHGYCEIYLNNTWVVLTPAFDLEISKKHFIIPVSFDGKNNAKFPEHDLNGYKFMEYKKYHGTFLDLPKGVVPNYFGEKFGLDIEQKSKNLFKSRISPIL